MCASVLFESRGYKPDKKQAKLRQWRDHRKSDCLRTSLETIGALKNSYNTLWLLQRTFIDFIQLAKVSFFSCIPVFHEAMYMIG